MRAITTIIAWRRGLTLPLVLALAIGCGEAPRFNFEGEWIGFRKIPSDPNANPDVVRSASEVKIIIKPNSRFDMFYKLIPTSGNVSISGNKATLTVTNTIDPHLDRDHAKLREMYAPIELTGQKDLTVVFFDPKSTDGEKVTLKRIATP